MLVSRGDVVDCSGRPAVVVQNDIGNRNSNSTIIVYVNEECKRMDLPTHVYLESNGRFVCVCCEHIHTMPVKSIREIIGHCTLHEMQNINKALRVSMGI